MPMPAATRPTSHVWLAPMLALGLVWALLIALAGADWAAMAGQWWTSSTYTHVLLVPPIIIWLVWQRVPDLAKLSAVCWWPALAGMGHGLCRADLGREGCRRDRSYHLWLDILCAGYRLGFGGGVAVF